MTASKYFLFLILGIAAVYGIHFSLLNAQVVSYKWFHFNLFDGIVIFLFLVGGLLVAPAIRKSAEQFVMKFMILTTVQLLSALSIIAAVIYTKQPQARHLAFNILAFFVALLIIQSVLLVIGLNKNKANQDLSE